MNWSGFAAGTLLFFTSALYGQPSEVPPLWQEGYLDIHHINTARGNATFFIFPDGTTMLFDAGAKRVPTGKEQEYFSIPPPDSLSAGGHLVRYIKRMFPLGWTPALDYAVVSHFHDDHYGWVDSSSAWSTGGAYRLSGITEVGDRVPIGTLIDRGYPNYSFPVDVRATYKHDATFNNYQAFLAAQQARRGLRVERLRAGRCDQIVLKKKPGSYPSFRVRNVKVNGTIWTGTGDRTKDFVFRSPLVNGQEIDENALSIVLTIRYGAFDYYTGADITGRTDWGDSDLETPVAQAVGRVDALALNHHGYRDASNDFFLRTLAPTVAIHQVIHDPHYQTAILRSLAALPVHVFTYNMHDRTRNAFGTEVSKIYKSTQGHVVIRVLPGGSQYWILTLDDQDANLPIRQAFGPYASDRK